jgi:predicted enzyme related to lactoylglutathione lyase
MIRGVHTMFYSSEAEKLREFLRDVIGFRKFSDAGEGWLIFDLPEADMGVHPTEGNDPPSGTPDISFYCDDIHGTVRDLKAKGVPFVQEIEDHGYGWVTHFLMPGDIRVQLYEPKYRK